MRRPTVRRPLLLLSRLLPNRLRPRRLLRDESSGRKVACRVQKVFFLERGARAFGCGDCCRVRGVGPCVRHHAMPDEAPARRAMPHLRNHTGVCGVVPGRCVRSVCATAACDVLQPVWVSHPACDTDRVRSKEDGGFFGCGIPFGCLLVSRRRRRSRKLDLCHPAWELIGETVV